MDYEHLSRRTPRLRFFSENYLRVMKQILKSDIPKIQGPDLLLNLTFKIPDRTAQAWILQDPELNLTL